MSYTEEEFWNAYGNFLSESEERHTNVISRIYPFEVGMNKSIIDLGCGQYASAAKLIPHSEYLGVDEHNPGKRSDLDDFCFLKANYRELSINSKFDGFVSLFSAEITAPEEINKQFYHQMFKMTGAKWGIVSGFYYRHKEKQKVIEETGGIKSYQTFPWLPPESPLYSVKQFCINAPSAMFGPDVVEVWRVMIRNVSDDEEKEIPTNPRNPPPREWAKG